LELLDMDFLRRLERVVCVVLGTQLGSVDAVASACGFASALQASSLLILMGKTNTHQSPK
jgi:hypothetical protein